MGFTRVSRVRVKVCVGVRSVFRVNVSVGVNFFGFTPVCHGRELSVLLVQMK